jgi:lipoprotein LprG
MQGMQTRKRFAVLFSLFAVVLAGVLLASGCSKSEGSQAPLPDAAALLKQSADTTRAQQSVHLVLTVNGKVPSMTLSKLAGDLTLSPAVAAKGEADLTFAGAPIKGAPFVVVDGTLYAALSSGGQPIEIGPAAEVYDVSAILRPETGLSNILSNFSNPKAEGRETINGVSTIKITGTVSADAVNKIAPQLKASAPVPGTAWIEESGNHQLEQAQLEVSPGNNIQMTLTDWGKPVNVSKPSE